MPSSEQKRENVFNGEVGGSVIVVGVRVKRTSERKSETLRDCLASQVDLCLWLKFNKEFQVRLTIIQITKI